MRAPALCTATGGLLLFAFVVASVAPAQAATLAGVTIPDEADVAGETIALRGAGLRKKFVLKLYVAGLYVADQAADGPTIAAADAPMMIRLAIRSDLVTRSRMVDSLKEGFEKSTGGNTAPVQDGIDTLIAAMPDDIDPGEVYDLVYTPDAGTTLITDGETLATIDGIAFKEALFGIWLSKDPIQASLKKGMLGG